VCLLPQCSDYEAIVEDFVALQFIPRGTDLRPILPVLAKVFDKALEGGGAKNINFQASSWF
jgi:aarF domain-containing kinase